MTKVFFRRAVGRPVVVRQVKMCYATIKCTAENGTAGLKNIGSAEVLPQAEGDGRQDQAKSAAAAEFGALIPFRFWHITHKRYSPLSRFGGYFGFQVNCAQRTK
jgi:hypothetical protein